jgi:hypothetical protein
VVEPSQIDDVREVRREWGTRRKNRKR